ncbi:MAG TPA: VWA domain-containing protein [Candidatus Binatia bacterium]|nr:VWA domain-containing protein [Candidatus Binatia bacterium]
MRLTINKLALLGLVLPFLYCPPVPAAESSRQQANEGQASASPGTQYSLSVEAPLVVVDVLVTDENGTVLRGLRQENFRILDEGKSQLIRDFAPTTAPITVVILMEYSGLAYDYFAYKAASWGTEFLDHLELDDWVALVTYDMKPTVRVDFTKSKPAVEQALKELSYPEFREANMFDALADTLDQLAEVKGKKSILLITTGADTFSRTTLDELYSKLKETDVTIFTIGVAEQEYMMSEMRGGGSNIGYMQMKNQLQTFANQTGGFAWFPRFEGELPDLFRSVGGILRNQYAVSFSLPREARDGRYHKLKVEVIGTDGLPLKVKDEKGKYRKVVIYAREGYIAPTTSTQN